MTVLAVEPGCRAGSGNTGAEERFSSWAGIKDAHPFADQTIVDNNSPSDGDPGPAKRIDANDGELDYIEYYDDGEWHAVVMDGTNPVAAGYGGSPEQARKALFGTAGSSSAFFRIN